MKKTVKIVLVVVVVIVVLLAVGVFALDRYVKSPQFKEFVVAKTQEQLAVPIQVESFQASLFSGFELKGLTVKNPQGSQTPNLLDTKLLVFRYRLMPLLRKRVEIETVTVDSPTIVLEKSADGTWNYEKLTKAESAKEKSGAGAGDSGKSAGSAPSGLGFEISKLAVANANLLFLKPEGKKLLEVSGLTVDSSLGGTETALSGRGQLAIARAAVTESIEAREVRSVIVMDPQALRLPNLTARVEDGTLKGSVLVDLQKEGYPYTVHAEVADVDVAKLGARFSDKAKYLTGKLMLNTDLEGVGGDTKTLKGKGSARINGGTLSGVPLLQTLATLLRTTQLERIQFDEMTLEYTMDNGVIETPVIKVISKDIQITGSGKTDFDFNLDHQLTLALSPAILPHVPKEIADVFGKREDGFRTIDFKVTGPYDKPKTDLADRLVKSAAGSLIEKGLQQLLDKEKKKKDQ